MNDVSVEELTRQINLLSVEAAALKRDLAAFRESGGATNRLAAGGTPPHTPSSAPGRAIAVVILAAFVAAAVSIGVVWVLASNMLKSSATNLEANASRPAPRQEKVVVQFGKFTAANRVADEAFAFDWNLKTPVDPTRVVRVTPELLGPSPPVAVSAEITQDGKKCRMTVTGDTAALLQKLANGLDAKVTIVMDVDQLGALQHK
jgi:hypothetical protein